MSTVFVLGAGASVPYGFPTGKELVRKILELGGYSGHSRHDGKSNILKVTDEPSFQSFCRAFAESGRNSIDTFLEQREDLREIGKYAIASVILAYETNTSAFPRDLPNNDWYRHFFEYIAPDLDSFNAQDIKVITFNYDRSFEHFLHTALCRSFNIAEARKHVEKLSIVHVHGKLGLLPWPESMPGQPFCTPFTQPIGDPQKDLNVIIEPVGFLFKET